MFKFYGFFLNSRVIPNSGLRILLLFRYRVENDLHLHAKKTLNFSRRDLCFSTGFSYSSVQKGLRQLSELGLIKLDPLDKGSKQWVRLTEETEYNWQMIRDLDKKQ